MTQLFLPGGWRRVAAFVVLCVACVGGAILYLLNALDRVNLAGKPMPAPVSVFPPDSKAPSAESGARSPKAEQSVPLPKRADATAPERKLATASSAKNPGPAPSLLFRITSLGETYGQMGQTNLLAPDQLTVVSPLRCERLHFAAGRGVCLTAERRMLATYGAVVFDRKFQPRHQLRLSGVPSRARTDPDGRHAAITVFAAGHSYADTSFSTLTTFVDLDSGLTMVENMEQFAVAREGEPFQAVDFNFWGVTFARGGNRFYATLATGGRIYLIEGDLAGRRAKVVRAGIECPALSPDNTRIAFKKRTGGVMSAVSWRISVLDLRTMREWELAETRSVDDQVEWLDNTSILYSLSAATSGTPVTNVWTVAADGSGAPRLLVPGAYSPVVVH